MQREQVLSDFEYVDGLLYRRETLGRHKAGQPSGTITPQGRVAICYNRKMFLAHRLIWFMFHGEWPKQIDHIDRNPANNRIENLRACTVSQNQGNRVKDAANTSGFKGVTRHRQKWVAHLGRSYVGVFDSAEEAAHAYDQAAILYFGEFARINFPNPSSSNGTTP